MKVKWIVGGFVVGMVLALTSSVLANGNVHVSRFWHNHQPIYWPEWNSNGSQTERGQYAWDSIVLKPGQNYGGLSPAQHPENNLTDIFGLDDRRNAYQGRPRDALTTFSGGGFAISYSGSLIDNVRQLGGANQLGYGSGWANGNREARGWGRLDLVGFTYHHSLAPLLPKEVFRKEIQIFKQAWWKAWNGNGDLSDHSKGFFPTEMAYTRDLIDVLVDEGYEWVIVASHHISRTSPSYNNVANPEGSYQIFSSPPNKADQLGPTFNDGWWYGQPNPGNAAWNVAPFAYQLHRVKYVNPSNGQEKIMVAVPSDDVLSYRYGYANEGINKIQAHIAPFANDPNRPVIVMPSTDGDNAWGGGFSSWMEATPQFFNESANNGYVKNMPGSFVDSFKAHAPITHIEDGAWVFPEMCYGSPNFLKWIEPPLIPDNAAANDPRRYPNTKAMMEEPGFALKFYSYAPLMAGANYVITAEQIWKDNGGQVRPWVIQEPYDWDGNGFSDRNIVERAWHIYLKGLDSGFNYYGGLGNDDEAKPGLATKRASDLLHSYIQTNINDDRTPPTILKPQRFPYNPGWYTFGWFNSFGSGTNAAFLKRMPSEFYVWTHAFDVSGISSVNLKVRIDNDGVNSMANNQNETYAGGADVGSWITIPMTQRVLPKTRSELNALANNGQIDYFVFDPSFWPEPKVADYYFAKITDNNVPSFRGKLLDYYVEATDTRGNVHQSEIQHVWVENDGGSSSNPSTVSFSNDPRDCAPLTVTYSANQGPLSNSAPVKLWISFNQGTNFASYVMTNQGSGVHAYTIGTVPDNAPSAIVYFQDNAETITDNRNGLNWSTSIRDCDAPVGPGTASFITAAACEPVTVDYRQNSGVLSTATQIFAHVGFNNWQTVVPSQPMTKISNNVWRILIMPQTNATQLDLVFNNGAGTWDNNNGADWNFALTVCAGEPAPTGFSITNPPNNIVVGNATLTYNLQGIGESVAGDLRWTNSLTGDSGGALAGITWTIGALPLGVGSNVITVTGTNIGSSVVTSAFDQAVNYQGGLWTNNSNLGTGWGSGWALNAFGTAGHFIGTTAGNPNLTIATHGFGLWSQLDDLSEAIRPFTSPLTAGQTFRATIQNNWIMENQQGVGVSLRNSNGDSLIQFYFNGGDAEYTVEDALGGRDSGIGWTSQGLTVEFSILSSTSYVLKIGNEEIPGVYNGSLDQARFWNYSGGPGSNYDFFFSSLSVLSEGSGEGISTSATVVIVREAADGDSNSDGIPDWWYEQYSLDPNTPNLASIDSDDDGFTNWEEYIYDTDPTDDQSFNTTRIEHIADSSVMQIRIESPTSTGRWYDVFWATGLINSTWYPMDLNVPGNADNSPVMLQITNESAMRYYRSGAKLPPVPMP
ncbi:MAG TPA: carbohydrate-binding protein [Kiritimatiellia bacterium]|nr:carbohydrate-binding protein [Kiritimatiellia bacterium]